MFDTLQGTAVLVADDDADNAEVLSVLLGQHGASVRTAATGQEALELLQSWRPDILLIDLSMPDVDGYDFVKALRQNPAFAALPALAVTGHVYDTDKQRALDAGFDGHVGKPLDFSQLVETIVALTQARRSCAPIASP